MSWHLEIAGSKEDVIATIEEAESKEHGIPSDVAGYLKRAVAASQLRPQFAIYVKSSGHRDSKGTGSNEQNEIREILTKPWGSS